MHRRDVLNFNSNSDTSDKEVGKDFKKKCRDKTARPRDNANRQILRGAERDREIRNNYFWALHLNDRIDCLGSTWLKKCNLGRREARLER